jgi:hypothetical protein
MSKRKTPYSESSSAFQPITDDKPRQIDEKKENLSRKSTLPTLDRLPLVLLGYIASFLTKTSLARLILVSQTFLRIEREEARISYRKGLLDFRRSNPLYNRAIFLVDRRDPFDLDLDAVQRWSIFNDLTSHCRLFSTLINKTYISLFIALLSSDQESAIDFINYKLKSTAGTNENVTDLVFLQKKWDGETAIMLANRLGLQNFLDHCFLHLIENVPDQKTLPVGKSSMRICKSADVLAFLDTEMRTEALWLYALADLCNQTTLREQISSRIHWDKTFYVEGFLDYPDANLNLVVIAALLGNRRLMKNVLEEISDEQKSLHMHSPVIFDVDKICCNNKPIKITPLVAALLDNNVELINDLLPLTLPTIDSDPDSRPERTILLVPLLLFYIKHQNLSKLTECLKEFDEIDGRVLVDPLVVYPQCLGIPAVTRQYNALLAVEKEENVPLQMRYNVLNVAVDSGWQEGADLLLSTAAQLIRKGKGQAILYETIGNEEVSLFKELVDRGVSLSIKYSVLEPHDLEYPLITVIRWNIEGIRDFITEQIGHEEAIRQIDDSQKNFPGVEDPIEEQDAIEALLDYRAELEESSKTQPLSPGVFSFFPTASSSQTTSLSSSSSPAP